MQLALLLVVCLAQRLPAQQAELRKYRYGLTAAQIESMGQDAYEKVFRQKTPDHDQGPMRGVSYGVYVDAYRENTGRRYRTGLPPATQKRLLELDRQIRFIGVLFARNDWLFTGGNAFDPESDALEYAEVERRLYTRTSETPDPSRMKRRLALYRAKIRAKARKERLDGAFGKPAEGRRQIDFNLTKMDGAVAKAESFCRAPRERAILLDFVAKHALARL